MQITAQSSPEPPRNVIVFGESGVGKSSVVNMIAREDVAKVSSGARGCTFESMPYDVDISEAKFRLYDMAGLNEATTIKAKDALSNLYNLMLKLDTGVSLLVYVIRGPRVREFTIKNYQLFYDALCQAEVPIVLVVTGLELEDSMDAWWKRNEAVFDKHGMTFDGQACITATRGKQRSGIWTFEEEYFESQKKLQKLMLDCSLHTPWKMGQQQWFVLVVKRMWTVFANAFRWPLVSGSQMLAHVLTNFGNPSIEHTTNSVDDDIEEGGPTEKAKGRKRVGEGGEDASQKAMEGSNDRETEQAKPEVEAAGKGVKEEAKEEVGESKEEVEEGAEKGAKEEAEKVVKEGAKGEVEKETDEGAKEGVEEVGKEAEEEDSAEAKEGTTDKLNNGGKVNAGKGEEDATSSLGKEDWHSLDDEVVNEAKGIAGVPTNK